MDFQTPNILEFALLNNHYQISKNEGNQNFKLSAPAWFLQKLALKCSVLICDYFYNYCVRILMKRFLLKLSFLPMSMSGYAPDKYLFKVSETTRINWFILGELSICHRRNKFCPHSGVDSCGNRLIGRY